jgi:hypothetical protein
VGTGPWGPWGPWGSGSRAHVTSPHLYVSQHTAPPARARRPAAELVAHAAHGRRRVRTRVLEIPRHADVAGRVRSQRAELGLYTLYHFCRSPAGERGGEADTRAAGPVSAASVKVR